MKKMMFCCTLLVLLIGTFIVTGRAQTTSAPIQLMVSIYTPPSHAFNLTMDAWAKELSTATAGRVTTKIVPSSALGPPDKQYEMVASGITDLAIHLPVFTPGRFPLTEVISLPFMFSSARQVLLTMFDLRSTLISEHKNVKLLTLFAGPPDHCYYTTKKPIKTLSDFKNMKIRATGFNATAVTKALGAIPVTIPPAECYGSVERGLVDGILWTAEALAAYKIIDLLGYGSMFGVYTNPFFLVMNLNTWNGLPEDVKITIEKISGESLASRMSDNQAKTEQAAIQAMRNKNLVFNTPTPEEKAKWVAAAAPVISDWIAGLEAKNIPGRQIYNRTRELAKKYEQ